MPSRRASSQWTLRRPDARSSVLSDLTGNPAAGVTANTLAIGLMGFPDPDVTAALAKSIPVGRTGEPVDIAAACVWLASDEASWVTGQTIQINGGSITT